jgi:hypothetical protein
MTAHSPLNIDDQANSSDYYTSAHSIPTAPTTTNEYTQFSNSTNHKQQQQQQQQKQYHSLVPSFYRPFQHSIVAAFPQQYHSLVPSLERWNAGTDAGTKE